MGQKSGASALSLQRNFGIGSYRTAWKLLCKLRSCTVLAGRSQLTGDVEVDEAFLGGVNNKQVIGVAAEKKGRGTGRIRLKHLKSRRAKEIQGFILEGRVPNVMEIGKVSPKLVIYNLKLLSDQILIG